MNKMVKRSLIVMPGLIFGLMVAGCKNEPEEEAVVDPSGGKTVEAKYWETYSTTSDYTKVTLSEKKSVFTDDQGFQYEDQAWTDGVNLYTYDKTYKDIIHFGIFTNDTTFKRPNFSYNYIYTKTSTEVSIAPELRGSYKLLTKSPYNNGTNFYIELTRFSMKQSFKVDNYPERNQTIFASFVWTVKNELYTKELKRINPVTGEFKNNILSINDVFLCSEGLKTYLL